MEETPKILVEPKIQRVPNELIVEIYKAIQNGEESEKKSLYLVTNSNEQSKLVSKEEENSIEIEYSVRKYKRMNNEIIFVFNIYNMRDNRFKDSKEWIMARKEIDDILSFFGKKGKDWILSRKTDEKPTIENANQVLRDYLIDSFYGEYPQKNSKTAFTILNKEEVGEYYFFISAHANSHPGAVHNTDSRLKSLKILDEKYKLHPNPRLAENSESVMLEVDFSDILNITLPFYKNHAIYVLYLCKFLEANMIYNYFDKVYVSYLELSIKEIKAIANKEIDIDDLYKQRQKEVDHNISFLYKNS